MIFYTEINFEKWRKYGIIGVMKNNGITEYFEEVEITKEYDGYYYSISEAITIVILGSICGLKNIRYQSNTPVGRKRKNTGIFKGEIPNRAYPLLLLAAVSDETDKTGITQ